MHELTGLSVANSAIFDDAVKKLPSVGVLHDQIEFPGSFDDLVQLDHVGVPHLLQNLDFPGNPIDVGLVLYFGFLQDLDGNFLPRDGLGS